jgi:hypothetical protein
MAYQAINITVTSYVDKMAFGFTACRRAVPNMQRLVDYLDDAFVELEKALGLKQARRAPTVRAAATPATAPKAAKPRAARKPKAASPAAKTPVAAPATAPKPAKPRAPRKARAASPAA